MKKENILQYIEKHPGLSSSEIAEYFSLNRVSIYYHLKKLLEENKIYKKGNKKSTRYFRLLNNIPSDIPEKIFSIIQQELGEAYEGLEKIDVPQLTNNLLSYLKSDGEWLYGMNAFKEIITKENNKQPPTLNLLQERLLNFLFLFFEEERKRRKNGFFHGKQSMIFILQSYNTSIFVDEIIFTQIATISRFGRLRGANEIYWGKKDQNLALLEAGISKGIDTIASYIKKKGINHCIYSPPTLKRIVQFKDVLKNLLKKEDVILQSISCTKKQESYKTLKPQKDTKGFDRIINARSSMILGNMKDFLNIPEIVIFDDNFTTGATINAIAEMMRNQGYQNKITAITVTGNFEYIPGITDDGDI